MEQMNLKDWSTLTYNQRKDWLNGQSSGRLAALLESIGEMLIQADDMDAELAFIENPSQDITSARDFTYNTLRDAERVIARELHERNNLIALTV